MSAVLPASAREPGTEELERTLGLGDLVLLVLGAVIGSGIFLVPGVVLAQLGGDVPFMLLAWCVAGGLSLLGALTYGELAAMKPEAGGLYVFVRDAFGPLPSFLLGWTFLFVIGSGSLATLAVAFTAYLDRVMPLGAAATRLVPLLLIGTLAAVNIRGTRSGIRLGNATTLLKTTAILVMSVAFIGRGSGLDGGLPGPATPPGGTSPLLALGVALVSVLWAYEGWQYATFSAGEVKDAQKHFPLGIAAGTTLLLLIYLLANWAYLAALGVEGMAASTAVAADAANVLFGSVASTLMAIVIAIAILSAANAQLLTGPRIYFKMGRDGVFFDALGRVSPRFGTPALAIAATSAWGVVLAATGTFEQLLTYVVFTGWIFYALGALSIFVFRRREPDAVRPFRVPGYPLTPILFVLSAVAIVINTLVVQPVQALAGLGIVAIGIPVYALWRRNS